MPQQRLLVSVVGPEEQTVVVDLYAEAKRYWKVLAQSPHLSEFRRLRMKLFMPVIKFIRSSNPDRYSGRGAVNGSRVYLGVGAKVDVTVLRMILLHELAHCACGLAGVSWGETPNRKTYHNETWRKVYRDAAAELWGFECPILPRHRYWMDDMLVAHLRRLWGLPWQKPSWMPAEDTCAPETATLLSLEQVPTRRAISAVEQQMAASKGDR